ncbi:hypothetical protein JCM10212_002357, partial [Sporobolomyces blumeae]
SAPARRALSTQTLSDLLSMFDSSSDRSSGTAHRSESDESLGITMVQFGEWKVGVLSALRTELEWRNDTRGIERVDALLGSSRRDQAGLCAPEHDVRSPTDPLAPSASRHSRSKPLCLAPLYTAVALAKSRIAIAQRVRPIARTVDVNDDDDDDDDDVDEARKGLSELVVAGGVLERLVGMDSSVWVDRDVESMVRRGRREERSWSDRDMGEGSGGDRGGGGAREGSAPGEASDDDDEEDEEEEEEEVGDKVDAGTGATDRSRRRLRREGGEMVADQGTFEVEFWTTVVELRLARDDFSVRSILECIPLLEKALDRSSKRLPTRENRRMTLRLVTDLAKLYHYLVVTADSSRDANVDVRFGAGRIAEWKRHRDRYAEQYLDLKRVDANDEVDDDDEEEEDGGANEPGSRSSRREGQGRERRERKGEALEWAKVVRVIDLVEKLVRIECGR